MWRAIEFILLSPVALIGLLIEYCRIGIRTIVRENQEKRYDLTEFSMELTVALRFSEVLFASKRNDSFLSNENKLYKRKGVDGFLRYLRQINARVIVFDTLSTIT